MPSKNKNLMSQMLRKRDGGSTIDASIPDDANPVEYIRQITPFVRKQVVLFNKVVEAKK